VGVRAMFGFNSTKEDSGLDPEEAIASYYPGPNSIPWHPGEMKAPHLYKVTFIGPAGAGKSSIVNRLVAHTFDSSYRATRQASQLFWRHVLKDTGNDIMFEIEDTPGVTAGLTEGGELQPQGLSEVDLLLRPLLWFEKRRKDKDTKSKKSDESEPLLPGGRPQIVKGGGSKGGGLANFSANAKALAAQAYASTSAAFASGAPQRANPIGDDRKRMGFVVVADLSSEASFEAAYAIIDRIFVRLQFDSKGDPMTCPAAVILVGNKSDLRSGQRAMPPEDELRREILSNYENPRADPRHNVLYVECSAQTNVGLEQVMLESLERIRQLPTRNRIRTSRYRAVGYFAHVKRKIFECCPWCFEFEMALKVFKAKVLNPCMAKLGLYKVFCECVPAKKVVRAIMKAYTQMCAFRWLCDWCPPFIIKFRKQTTASEEEAEVEQDNQDQQQDEA